MEHSCGAIVCETIEHCRALMGLAERGMRECGDESCIMLYGIMLDSAYRVKAAAENHHSEMMRGTPAQEEMAPWSLD